MKIKYNCVQIQFHFSLCFGGIRLHLCARPTRIGCTMHVQFARDPDDVYENN